jgi:hypothetical protein
MYLTVKLLDYTEMAKVVSNGCTILYYQQHCTNIQIFHILIALVTHIFIF